MSSSSKIFVRHKALGYVSSHVPVVTRYISRRRENLLVTSVGRALHTYGSNHFKLLSVTDLHPEDITCTAGDTYLVYSAAGKTIYAWRRGNELKHKYEGHKYTVKYLLTFGDHLISVDESSNLKLWNIKDETVYMELDFNNETFQISAIMHPYTYQNKILLGSEQGYLQLWNLLTSKLIYSFKGWGSGVSVLEQSPAVDIVGIGLKDGQIILHNLKYDKVVIKFQQDWGIVTSLAFRMDEAPIMISGTTYGHLIFWNLDEKKVFSQLLYAHQKIVTGLKCLPSEPLMVSSSPDNSLKLWIFDMPDGGARLLRLREGHSLPPTFVRFYGSNGHNLLVSGGDSSLRCFNTVTEIFNKSLGKATFRGNKVKKKKGQIHDRLKMPPIVAFSAEVTREKEWDNIAAIHLGIPEVTTWSYHKLKLGENKLVPDRFINYKNSNKIKCKGTATSVFITHCGNFVVIGYSTGHCDKFNIQSSIYRGSYGKETAHNGAVRGLAVDVLNLTLTTGSSDKLVKWWNFKAGQSEELCAIELEEGVSFFTYSPESALLAVALENFDIVLIDNDGKNIVRNLNAHMGKLTDLTFSPDSKWLISAGMDCFIFTWDLPSGCLVDQFKVDAPCTSLSFSPTGEFLASTHVDYLGVFLWSNRTLYNHVSLKPIKSTEDAPVMSLPSTVAQRTVTVSEDDEEADEVSQLSDQIQDLVTLSTLDSSKWKNLLNLDIIKRRNKPKEPLNKPKTAPFFLPTIPSSDVVFDFSDVKKDTRIEKVSTSHLETLTSFGKFLAQTETGSGYEEAFEKLKGMGPSALDFEINSLTSGFETSTTLLKKFMSMIKLVLDSRVDFELAQSYLGLFLKIHGQEIIENDELRICLKELQVSQVESWERIQNSLFYNLSVIQALKS